MSTRGVAPGWYVLTFQASNRLRPTFFERIWQPVATMITEPVSISMAGIFNDVYEKVRPLVPVADVQLAVEKCFFTEWIDGHCDGALFLVDPLDNEGLIADTHQHSCPAVLFQLQVVIEVQPGQVVQFYTGKNGMVGHVGRLELQWPAAERQKVNRSMLSFVMDFMWPRCLNNVYGSA